MENRNNSKTSRLSLKGSSQLGKKPGQNSVPGNGRSTSRVISAGGISRPNISLSAKEKDFAKAFLPNNLKPSSVWDGATASDIGTGFEIIQDTPVLEEFKFNNPFLRGRSEFIYFTIRPRYSVRKKKKVVTPINLDSKLDKGTRHKISKTLGVNIEDFSKFFLDEILPISMSIPSAGQRVDEIMQQLIDEKANLPMNFIQGKALQAICLRIIRFVSQKFNLTKAETKMMFREYSNANIFKA